MLTLLYLTNRGLHPMTGAMDHLGQYDLLAQCLEQQTHLDYEVIIVDRLNKLPRPEVAYAARRALGGVHFYRPRQTPWDGAFAPNAARNTGLIYARGKTIVGLDDCFALESPRYLARVAELAADGVYPASVLRQADESVAYPPQPLGPVPADKYCGGIIAYPLEAALAVNGWDERFDGGSGGDIDFFDRLRRHGVKFVRDAEVAVAGYGHGARTVAHPRCWRMAWKLATARREAGLLRGNAPWSAEELAQWSHCGRNVPGSTATGCCIITGSKCEYTAPEPPWVASVRNGLETKEWFNLARERERVGVDR